MKCLVAAIVIAVGCAEWHGRDATSRAVADVREIVRGVRAAGFVPVTAHDLDRILPRHGVRSVHMHELWSRPVRDIMWEAEGAQCSVYFSVTRLEQPGSYSDIQFGCGSLGHEQARAIAVQWVDSIAPPYAEPVRRLLRNTSGDVDREFEVTGKEGSVRVPFIIYHDREGWTVKIEVTDQGRSIAVVY